MLPGGDKTMPSKWSWRKVFIFEMEFKILSIGFKLHIHLER